MISVQWPSYVCISCRYGSRIGEQNGDVTRKWSAPSLLKIFLFPRRPPQDSMFRHFRLTPGWPHRSVQVIQPFLRLSHCNLSSGPFWPHKLWRHIRISWPRQSTWRQHRLLPVSAPWRESSTRHSSNSRLTAFAAISHQASHHLEWRPKSIWKNSHPVPFDARPLALQVWKWSDISIT